MSKQECSKAFWLQATAVNLSFAQESSAPNSQVKSTTVGAIIGGLMGMFIGAVIWAFLTFISGFKIGMMAIGVGYLAGFGVRILGKGFATYFGMIGGISALLGIVIGDSSLAM